MSDDSPSDPSEHGLVPGGDQPTMDRDTFHLLVARMHEDIKLAALNVGRTLGRIQAEKGWYWEYDSFADFLQHELGGARQRGYQLIRYAKLIDTAIGYSQYASLPARLDMALVPTERRVRGLLERYREEVVIERLRAWFDSGQSLDAPSSTDSDVLALSEPGEPTPIVTEDLGLADVSTQTDVSTTVDKPAADQLSTVVDSPPQEPLQFPPTTRSTKRPTQEQARAACDRILAAIAVDSAVADPEVLSSIRSPKWRHDTLDKLRRHAAWINAAITSLAGAR